MNIKNLVQNRYYLISLNKQSQYKWIGRYNTDYNPKPIQIILNSNSLLKFENIFVYRRAWKRWKKSNTGEPLLFHSSEIRKIKEVKLSDYLSNEQILEMLL